MLTPPTHPVSGLYAPELPLLLDSEDSCASAFASASAVLSIFSNSLQPHQSLLLHSHSLSHSPPLISSLLSRWLKREDERGVYNKRWKELNCKMRQFYCVPAMNTTSFPNTRLSLCRKHGTLSCVTLRFSVYKNNCSSTHRHNRQPSTADQYRRHCHHQFIHYAIT